MNLDKDKLVIEELSRMKSLFGYERGKVISEQEFNEDTIGSYERRDLQRIDPGGSHLSAGDKAADKAAAEKAATSIATSGWWDSYPTLTKFVKNKTQFSNWYAPQVKNKDTGAIAAGQKLGVANPEWWEWFKDNRFYIFNDVNNALAGVKWIKSGKWAEKDGVLTMTTDDGNSFNTSTLTWEKKKAVTEKPSAPPQIPTELKDINGVKAFQDWLDENKAGWASGYANNILNKTGKGYGRMGPRTSKAWGLFKDEYLNPQKLTQDIPNITTQEIQQINAGTQPQSDLGAQTPVTNTTTTTTSTETISQYPPDEPGQPGEYKDGWYYDEKSQQWYKPQ